MASGFIIWFTGLSGSGKSTLASLVSDRLRSDHIHVECLDGDEVRKHLSWGLGFSREDRDRNVRRIGYVARMVARSGSCAITAAISPYRSIRNEIRTQTDRFCEVYCECPLEVLAERDPKGLYKRAMAGEIKNFTGVDDPYEEPDAPEVHLRTDRQTPAECVEEILSKLEELGFIGHDASAGVFPAPYGGELIQAAVGDLHEGRKIEGTLEVTSSTRDLSLVIAAGYLSPVGGFMTRRELEKVRSQGMLERGLAWSEPIALSVTEEQASFVKEDGFVLLSAEGSPFARMHVQGVWPQEAGRLGITGLLEAVSPDFALNPTARQTRQRLMQANAGGCAVLFCESGVEPQVLARVAVAAEAAGAAVVFVPPEHQLEVEKAVPPEVIVLALPPGLAGSSGAPLRDVVARNLGARRALSL